VTKSVPECQTILDSTAARDDGRGGTETAGRAQFHTALEADVCLQETMQY